MATKGTAGKSASGASMSKYDVEVEARLQALASAVATLQAHSHEAPCDTGGDLAAAVKALVRPEALAPSADDLDQ